jgi:tRNA A-37 threonylcarbamoyl transferase component Bud32
VTADAGDGAHLRLAPAWDHAEGRAFCRGLEALVAALPESAVLYRGRNTLYRCRALGCDIVIKRFQLGANPWKRIVERLGEGKAPRTLAIALHLRDLGIATPEPLAAVERRVAGRPAAAFYLCRDLGDAPTARDLVRDRSDPRRASALDALGSFVARLHDAGVLHRDLTLGNVLRTADGDHALVDLNRIRFTRVGAVGGLLNLLTLGLRGDDLDALLAGYRRERVIDGGTLGELDAHAAHALAAGERLRWALKRASRPWRRRIGF